MSVHLYGVLAYLLVQVGIGVWVSRRIKTEDDYLVAGRRLGPPLAIFSIFATWFGAESLIGSAGRSYQHGASLASAEPFGYGVCLVVMGLVFAVPLWRRRLTTLADLFKSRFSVPVERVAAVLLIPGSILWAAAQVRALGGVLSTVSTLHAETATAVAAGITITYAVFGGLLVDAINDLIQGTVIIIGLALLTVAVIHAAGGLDGVAAVMATPGRLQWLPVEAGGPWAALERWAIPVCGSVVATELVGRVVACRSAGVARGAPVAAGAIYLLVGLMPAFIGLVGPQVVTGLSHPELVLPRLAATLLSKFGYALLIGAFLSAILSTVDSTLLVAAGLLSHNLIVPVTGWGSERARLLLARGCVLTFGIIAYLLALHAEGVYALVEQASAFGSAGSLIVVTFGLFTRVGGPRAALATLVGSLVVYLGGLIIGFAYPFLLSLGLSLGLYLSIAAVEHLLGHRVPALAALERPAELTPEVTDRSSPTATSATADHQAQPAVPTTPGAAANRRAPASQPRT